MNKTESANLILKLYELRREPVMREARNWMITFFPESAQDVLRAMTSMETSAFYRMVTTYWDMAASFVNHEAIDAEMFAETQSEHIVVFAKIEPFLNELRETMGSPNYLKNLETLIMKMPDAKKMLAHRREIIREMVKRMNKSRADAANLV